MIYLDNSATTKPCFEAQTAAIKAMENYANPSSSHFLGINAEKLLESSRESVARLIHALPSEIIFTGSGTQSNNLAIFGGANIKVGSHIITSEIEHLSVLSAFKSLEQNGFEVSYIKPMPDGTIRQEDILAEVRGNTSFVSIMLINNETGAINNLSGLKDSITKKSPRALLHTDAVQAFGKFDLRQLGVDLMSISAHKIHGLKGSAALYIKKGVKIKQTVFGGGQESNLCSGTQNMPGIAAFAAAADAVNFDDAAKVSRLKDKLSTALSGLDGVVINSINSSPYILNASFTKTRSEIMLNALSSVGICVSAGSACSEKRSKGNRVLTAMGNLYGDSAIRFSFCRYNTMEEIDEAIEKIKLIMKDLKI